MNAATHSPPLDQDQKRRLEEAAIAVYERYEIEVVERYTLCPWAERSRQEGRTRQLVCHDVEPDIESALPFFAELAADERVEVGFVLYPRVVWTRSRFERFVSEARELDQARAGDGGPAFAAAAFHPVASADLEAKTQPYQLVPFVRRSPDPTIQLIRRTVLAAVRRPGDGGTGYVDPSTITDLREFLSRPKKKPLHERVAGANYDTVQRVGTDEFEQVFAALARDRRERYARILGADDPCVAAVGRSA